jgi:hypothetical protein
VPGLFATLWWGEIMMYVHSHSMIVGLGRDIIMLQRRQATAAIIAQHCDIKE